MNEHTISTGAKKQIAVTPISIIGITTICLPAGSGGRD
jgi:hypothetical protein